MMSSRPKEKTALPNGIDNRKETIITGRAGQPVGRTAVRLLNACNEFTGEVVTSAAGYFRFFAAL
ncbi:hypothetical protein A5661_19425 [Mycobacterium asiaticum]|nr:hypothetical protein A5661_19425 [Mycobacterium asiaticum]